ncbi:hypothetical protein [Nostoc sp.]|uniref:hypothetical protein n=1 Tax=Nostoc sp. TaxID=1180 RepID=UPI002FF7EC2C
MSDDTDVVWISSSHVLQRFDQPLLQYISQYINVDLWEYHYHKDQGSFIDEAVDLMYEFLAHLFSSYTFSRSWCGWCDRLKYYH